jgi:hypothetical protein
MSGSSMLRLRHTQGMQQQQQQQQQEVSGRRLACSTEQQPQALLRPLSGLFGLHDHHIC